MTTAREPKGRSIEGEVVFLGTGTSVGVPVIGCACSTCLSPDPRNRRLRCSVALGLPQGHLLIDTPPDLRTQLLRADIGAIHALLFTHGHADHVFGLDDVRMFPYYLGHSLPVYCDEGVEVRLRRSFDYAFSDDGSPYAGGVPKLDIRRIGLQPFTVLGALIVPLRLLHGRQEVLGFRIGNVAYCTDTNHIPPETESMLRGLDVLILDALRPRPHPTHFSLQEAVVAARRIAARRTLFTHISHEMEHAEVNATLPPGMELAYDGLSIPLT